MTQKAERLPSAIDRLLELQQSIDDLFGLNRFGLIPKSVSAAVMGSAAGGGEKVTGSGNFLATQGDTMVGPIAIFPNQVAIEIDADGIVDISKNTEVGYTSYVRITTSGASAIMDTLEGAGFDGQLVWVENLDSTFTIAQATDVNGGNIVTADGNDIVNTTQQVTPMIFEAALVPSTGVTGGWRVIAGGGTGGGDVTLPIIVPVLVLGTVTTAQDIDISLTTGHSASLTLGANIDITFSNFPTSGNQEEWEVEVTQDGTTAFEITWPSEVINPPAASEFETLGSVTIVLFRTNDGGVIVRVANTVTTTGVDLSQWATFTAVQDIDYGTFDGINIDRLRFFSDSAAPATSGDPSIFLDGVSNMVYNLADQKQFFWTMDSKSRMALDQSGTNNDTLLTVETDSSNASAIPFINIFRDDPTPETGLGTDSEITNLQFIGTNAATNGGAQVGNTVYSKIVTIYESVITGREASSLNFFTSFDTSTATQLKAFLGLNNSNSEEIDAFVDFNLNENNITNVADIEGIDDDTTQFQIIFDAAEDSDTAISNQNGALDRINVFAGGINGTFFLFNTTNSEYQMGIPVDVDAYWSLGNHRLEFDALTTPLDGVVGNDSGVVFLDTGTDPPILKIKKKSSVGAVSVISLEGAGGDVDGPVGSTDNAIARFDGTTGKIIQNSGVTISDTTGDINILNEAKITGSLDTSVQHIQAFGTTSGIAGDSSWAINIGQTGFFQVSDSNGIKFRVAGATAGNFSLTEVIGLSIEDTTLMTEISLPSNPAANKGLIYLRDVAGITTPFFLDSAGTESSMIGGAAGANTELSNLDSVTLINSTLRPASDGSASLGTASERWDNVLVNTVDIQDSDTSNVPSSIATTIVGDLGGMNFGIPATNDAFSFFFNGDPLIVFEDNEINFPGEGHDIRFTSIGLALTVSSTADTVIFTTGDSRSNETVEIRDVGTNWLSSTTSTSAVLFQLIQNNDTPADFRTLGNIDFIAENSASANLIYARVSASSQDTTSTTEDGLLQLGVVSGGTLIASIDMEGDSAGGSLIGFFGVTPVAQQQLDANPTNTEISTALRNLGLTTL